MTCDGMRVFFATECATMHILSTLWLFNIAMENGPFIDDFPS